MNRPSFAILFALSAHAIAADPVLPARPGDLLQALPIRPEGASITRSEAETTFVEWYATRATRVFAFKANPPVQEAASVEVSITDTGGFRSALAAFANFKPGRIENVEKRYLGVVPVIQFTDSSGSNFCQALVSGRYIVEVSTSGAQKDPVQWLRALRFQGLPAQAAGTPSKAIQQADLVFIDELQPANNRSTSVHVTDREALARTLRSLPQLPEAASQ